MKVYRELLEYYFVRYIKSISMIIPIVMWFLSQYILYSLNEDKWTSIFTGSVTFIFLLMVWIGFAYVESINELEEDMFLLRLQDKKIYYRSRVIFVYLIGFILSLTGAVIPIILSLFGIFRNTPTGSDIVSYIIFLYLVIKFGSFNRIVILLSITKLNFPSVIKVLIYSVIYSFVCIFIRLFILKRSKIQ